MKINQLDPNFAPSRAKGEKFVFYNPHTLNLEGFPWEEANDVPYMRLPQAILPSLPESLCEVQKFTAGGVVRFKTDSKSLVIRGRYLPFEMHRLSPLIAQAGFDVMVRKDNCNRLVATLCAEPREICEGKFDFEYSCPLSGSMSEYRIYTPLYTGIEYFEIGVDDGALVEKAAPHAIEKPIAFYGSSITQGGCSTRPSNTYTALLTAWLDAELTNLGYGGNAKGEIEIAEAISELPMSCFVLDYDHNAPDYEHLAKTHEKFFAAIREKQPDLPIIIISDPLQNVSRAEPVLKRRDVIKKTYENAVNKGDKNVYFIDGTEFFASMQRDLVSVDLVHPSDLGFHIMAQKILPVIKKAMAM